MGLQEAEMSDSKSWAGLPLTLAAAILTAAVTYSASFLNARREAELRFVNDQIEKLYGPLYALSTANAVSWSHFSRIHGPGRKHYFDDADPPRAEDVAAWRLWMTTVFQPRNQAISKAIAGNAQLIIGTNMPRQFQLMLSHTEAYNAAIARWREDDATRCAPGRPCAYRTAAANTALVNYPPGFERCVAEDYQKLKRLQRRLRDTFVLLGAPATERSRHCE
jgi:hypothetical protein